MQENNINYPKFKVCVRCFTFNQAKYITDALNGFTMQQTDFPFVCCIVDDASTDGEQQVIMEYVQEHFDMSDASVSYRKETDYADITYAQHKENKNCYFAVLLLKENHYSQRKDKMPYLSEWRDNTEYEALCEGDDYWIHPKKLQMQVNILETHPEVGLVRTDCDKYIEKNNTMIFAVFSLFPYNKIKDTFRDYLIYGWWAAPCTWMYRSKFQKIILQNRKEIGSENGKCFFGDIFLLLSVIEKSKVKFLSCVTTVYRELKLSASHFSDRKSEIRFYRMVLNTRLCFAKQHPFIILMIWFNATRYYLSQMKNMFTDVLFQKSAE